jgi:hypothetical protein
MPLDPFGVLYVARTEYWPADRRATVLLHFVEQLIPRLDDGFELDDFLVLFDSCARDANTEVGPLATRIIHQTKDLDDAERAASLFCFLQLVSWKITDQELMTAEIFESMMDEWHADVPDLLKSALHLDSLTVS